MRALFDVSVLVALHDEHHVHFEPVAHWMADHVDQGWASCPLTQNGCLRVLSQPSYPNTRPMSQLWEPLHAAFSQRAHEFWADDLSLFDAQRIRRDRIHGHRQLTDIYLLALAVKHGGRLVTLDTAIPLEAVRGATAKHLVRIAAP